jgi:hypothetical protein
MVLVLINNRLGPRLIKRKSLVRINFSSLMRTCQKEKEKKESTNKSCIGGSKCHN